MTELDRLQEIERAARIVFANLEARIGAAVAAKQPVPLFDGIADLHDALNRRADT